MNNFRLSKRSLARLNDVNEHLEYCVFHAIKYTHVDFGVTCGLRTDDEQLRLVEKGASQTISSKHLTGLAVDLVAYIDHRVSWELSLYDEIADAMRAAAIEIGLGLRWGAAWQIPDIREWENPMGDAMMDYINLRRSQGLRPFIDAPHFEIT